MRSFLSKPQHHLHGVVAQMLLAAYFRAEVVCCDYDDAALSFCRVDRGVPTRFRTREVEP